MRNCNGVTLTTDSLVSEGKLTTVQVAKFDKVGDFDYMIYAERSMKRMPNVDKVKQMELEATVQIYAPGHPGPMYTVELPVYGANERERYWVAFCMRGGRGINFDGLSVADPEPLFSRKPLVYN